MFYFVITRKTYIFALLYYWTIPSNKLRSLLCLYGRGFLLKNNFYRITFFTNQNYIYLYTSLLHYIK
nr:MAG TPA: hypothetical protein [Caudoviricetes sp.]